VELVLQEQVVKATQVEMDQTVPLVLVFGLAEVVALVALVHLALLAVLAVLAQVHLQEPLAEVVAVVVTLTKAALLVVLEVGVQVLMLLQ
jgi:hypothetical protein